MPFFLKFSAVLHKSLQEGLVSILINMQDLPYFDTSYQFPENGAQNVSKTPVLQWSAHDNDGDVLANGVYLYKIILRNAEEQKEEISKLVILR